MNESISAYSVKWKTTVWHRLRANKRRIRWHSSNWENVRASPFHICSYSLLSVLMSCKSLNVHVQKSCIYILCICFGPIKYCKNMVTVCQSIPQQWSQISFMTHSWLYKHPFSCNAILQFTVFSHIYTAYIYRTFCTDSCNRPNLIHWQELLSLPYQLPNSPTCSLWLLVVGIVYEKYTQPHSHTTVC